MEKIISFIKKHWQELALLSFMVIAGVLRFSNIFDLSFFTYDQSRDALFVKRMIVDGEFRLLGTQTSLPGMYLPPYYFYTIAPVLWLFRLNPVGIDIYSAFVGVLSIPLVYFIANKLFGKPAGVFSAGLFAVSPLVVELTRRAWNPNTLPFFIAIAFYFLYRYYKERKTKDFLFAFGFYGYCLSLHFGAWTLFPLFVFSWFFYLLKHKEIKGLLGSVGLTAFFVLPLLLFELRHNFMLFNQAKIFFFDGGHIGPSGGGFIEKFITSLVAIFTILISGKIFVGYGAPLEFSGKFSDFTSLSHPVSVVAQKPFSISFQWWGTLFFLVIVAISAAEINKKKESLLPLLMLWVWIFWGVFASRMYSGKFFFFYYLFLFPAPIFLFGFSLKKLWEKSHLKPVVLLVFGAIMVFFLRFTVAFQTSWRNIDDLKEVAKIVAENSGQVSFNLATIQRENDRWDRNAVDYRYFTEAFYNKRALDWYPEDYEKAQTLFVIDETGETDPTRSNIMEIEKFSPEEIVGQWKATKGIVIYKLSKKQNQ